MIDQNMVPAALIVFCSFLVVGLTISFVSSRTAMQRQRDVYSLMASPPEKPWLEDSPSFGATLLSWLFLGVGTYIALTLLFGHGHLLFVS